MKLIWHIVRKDLRLVRLHWLLLAVTGVVVYYLALRIAPPEQRWERSDVTSFFVVYLAVWLSLIPALLQTDPPTGTTGFWMTRPIAGRTVYAAKLIGAVLALILMVGAHGLFLFTQGFQVGQIATVLDSFVPSLVAIFFSAFLIASLTRSLGHFWFVVFAIGVGSVVAMGVLTAVSPQPNQSPPSELTRTREVLCFFLITSGALLLTWWQYRHRQTLRGWLGVAVLVMGVLLLIQLWPWSVGGPVERSIPEVSWTTRVVKEEPRGPDSTTTFPPLVVQMVPPSGSVARLDGITGRITWSDGSVSQTEGISQTYTGRLAAVKAELPAGYRIAEAGQPEDVPTNVRLFNDPESVRTGDLRPTRLDARISGEQLRYFLLGKVKLARGALVVRQGSKLEVLEVPLDNPAHHLTVKYQLLHYGKFNHGWQRMPLLVLINPVRKEARVLPSRGRDVRVKNGIPGLDLMAVTWSFQADAVDEAGTASVDDAWLSEAELWVFGEVFEGAVRQHFSSILQEENGRLSWMIVEPVNPPPSASRQDTIFLNPFIETEP